ncbi:DUF2938 domain-containing protein [Salinisphaera sp. Q1T1-3]|uniref:DUF2938 domain-containing protein n=1 Tax=Salinisphaera sp. Q1T1-3 TaxID=2321229 RepID=UPI000E72F795|nr:DUF2938 domain-containing protein [Salinisphaera sp. Q1T1-3]RJS93560.1 DUF2938 domain-containing protein [Salinisphaera sp. Q1T1-3]
MHDLVTALGAATAIGITATAFMDACAWMQQRIFGIPGLNYALVGRWIGHMSRGQFSHAAIADSPRVASEALIGWLVHYAIGLVFAAILLIACSLEWASDPTLLPALIVGGLSVAAPFLIMQPAFGAGLAASHSARPNAARIRSLIAHISFGVGLYLGGVILSLSGLIPSNSV